MRLKRTPISPLQNSQEDGTGYYSLIRKSASANVKGPYPSKKTHARIVATAGGLNNGWLDTNFPPFFSGLAYVMPMCVFVYLKKQWLTGKTPHIPSVQLLVLCFKAID